MEAMRDQKPSGRLTQQVTSIGGQRGYATLPEGNDAPADQSVESRTFSIYWASKWAVEGFTEAISHEVKPDVSMLSKPPSLPNPL